MGVGNRSLNLTPDERRSYGQLFKSADRESVGVVTGDVAAKFFEKSGLDPRILGKVRELVTANAVVSVLTELVTLDMGDCRYRESWILDADRLWHGAEADWTRTKWTRTASRASIST